jgi:hypothetical protein
MKHDRCPCCRANYLTLGDANHHDDEDVSPRIVTTNPSNSEQGQEQLSYLRQTNNIGSISTQCDGPTVPTCES